MKHNWHIFKENINLKLQKSFCFVDTETNIIQINDKTQELNFKLGCCIFWNRTKQNNNILYRNTFFNVSDFWNSLDNKFNDNNKDLILFAHNTQFDFKILDGFKQLSIRNWKLESFYIKSNTFILIWKKEKYTLHIWDTLNYVNKSLKELGKSLNYEKMEINFNQANDFYLAKYCMNDVRIIYLFIKRLIDFLEVNDLSRLKATAGSLSLNTFRHKFYKENKKQILIHDWKKAIVLERNSYHGGITDCFQIGSFDDVYKLDINSMYPSVMKKHRLPIRLLLWQNEGIHNQEYLMNLYNQSKRIKNVCCIMKVDVYIPKHSAYILNDFGLDKNTFAYSNDLNDLITISLCQPELEFIENNGGIIKRIHEIALYYCRYIFKKFVKFFYNKRIAYKKINDNTNVELCKIILNSQYGKWGQREVQIEVLNEKSKFFIDNFNVIRLMINHRLEQLKSISQLNELSYLGTLNEYEIYIVNHRIYALSYKATNSKDSFVAISSFITSYSRMLLVNFIKIANKSNVYYCDTDSLFTNKDGYINLEIANCINDFELGKLKIENIGYCSIYAPKFYDFNNERKAKGIKKGSLLINESNDKAIYQVELWQKYKTDLKKGTKDKQIITKTIKELNKIYDKGKIINGKVYPYSQKEIFDLMDSN